METLSRTLPAPLDPALVAISSLDDLAEYLRAQREAIFRCVREGAGGMDSARRLTELVDSVVTRMLAIACERAGRGATVETVPIAVVATGGYGRRELCPFSDIDITFIPHRESDPVVDAIIREMFSLVMRVFIDQLGMDVGYAYRLITDCAALDHQTTSGLLDARLIAGNNRLFIQFEHDFWAYFNPADFIFTKLDERRGQQVKNGITPRTVEPNLKDGPGGMRDLHTAVWVTQARLSLAAARVRGDRALDVLRREAEVTAAEVEELREAKEFLFRVRNALHLATGAERDQLVVTRQEEVAELLGYATQASDAEGRARIGDGGPAGVAMEPSSDTHLISSGVPPVERFMRDYYRHAGNIHRIGNDVMRRAENSQLFLGIGLDCEQKQIVAANPALEHEDPVWMLWACELAQKYGLGWSDALERSVVDLTRKQPKVRDVVQGGQVFTRILASPRGAYETLQRMADLGILGWFLPEVGQVMDLIPYDSSHDFTVGQHSLYVVRNLDRIRLFGVAGRGPGTGAVLQPSPGAHESLRDFHELLSDLPHPEQLYLAALLHDTGKDDPERPHSDVGADLAYEVCCRLGWTEEATLNVAFLVRHHLLMSETSRLRDLTLDETIRDFTAVVDDVDRLHMLYLLTYADTSAVGAGIWTEVKGRFLRDLLHRAERALTKQEQEGEQGQEWLGRTRRRLLKELSVENLPPEEVAEHIESMPATYLLNTSLEEIALHVGFVRRARQGEPSIEFHDERDSTVTDVTICAPDDPTPGLLAKIASVFYATDVGVHSAQVFTRRPTEGDERVSDGDAGAVSRPIAIDHFFVDFRGRQLTPGKRGELARDMRAVLSGGLSVSELLTKKKLDPEIGGPVERITVRNDLSESYTVVEVAAADARSMLYRASGALSALGWDILSARVSHFGGLSVASFYVTGAKRLGDSAALAALQRIMPCSKGQRRK
jgi:[protein-PII] uridylyltransferase